MPAIARAPFRLRPPDPAEALVDRGRLLDALQGRFDRRLTVVSAAGGFGKTTLLAQAIGENALDPLGVDAWLQVLDPDRRPTHLLAGIDQTLREAAARIGGPSTDGYGDASVAEHAAPTIGEVVERIWSFAPRHVALVLDDVHRIDGSEGEQALGEICAQLPANGHLVVATRTLPRLELHLFRARGELLIVDEAELAFTRSEQEEFARVRQLEIAPAEIPAWPAMAALMSTVGRSATNDLIWDAVLGGLEPARRERLALVVRLGTIDDELVAAALGSDVSAASVVEGLPLIDRLDGAFRFHELWRVMLGDVGSVDRWRAALVAGAEVLIARGELERGVRCLHEAGAGDRIVQLARRFGMAPISAGLSGAVAAMFIEHLPAEHRVGAIGRYLRTISTTAFQSDGVIEELRAIRSLALDEGDVELATLTLWRETQIHGDVRPGALSSDAHRDLVGEIERFAPEWPLARCALGLVRSHAAEARRDVDAALSALSLFEGADPVLARTSTTSRCVALGHPERVDVTLDDVLGEGISDPVSAQVVWFRGEIDPSVAWPITRELPAAYGNRRLPNVQVRLLGVLTSVALAAGDLAGARELADQALELARALQPRPAAFADVADALVILATEGDDAASRRLAASLASVPLEPWPAWAYLGALCAIRALVPGSAWLDHVAFGRSISAAVSAGRAVETLRNDLDPTPARALPWEATDLMRVHVPPSMLCELAAAVAKHDPAAARCLDTVPAATRWLRRLVDHEHADVRSVARARIAGTPDPPPYHLHITTLGELSVRRSDGVPVGDRVRGGRVQQLLARLLVDESPLRTQLAEQMWPDLGEKQAGANLRVTLASLLDAIEPGRATGTSWFIETRDARLALGNDALDIDVRRFEEHARAAREAERASRLTAALEHHRAAAALYGGSFMPGVEDDVVVHERLRLQALAYNAACRSAELQLARGEPEEALRSAIDAVRIDPLAERGRRIEIRCHLALGSMRGARTAAARLRDALDAEGLKPDRETQRLLAGLEGTGSRVT